MKNLLRFGYIIILACVLAFPFLGHSNADAFNGNKIIDDSIFSNAGTMSSGQIDNWLNVNFPSSCISTNNGFSAPDPTGYSSSTGYTYGGNVSAGHVISDAALAYNINPQVLLATLQKESSVVSGDASYHCQYINTAMGYGCPDNGDCPTNPATMSGFSKQVIHAAWLFKFGQQRSLGNTGWNVQLNNLPQPGDHWDNSDDPPTCYGGPMTQGMLSRGCGQASTYFDGYYPIDGTNVHIESGATAALYWYTPHFSGNQHFFSIFTSWFGSTTLPVAFKTPNSAAVYIQASGYKFTVPSMALLQDYGVSPGSIQTISQASADSIPVPDQSSGYSSGLGYLVKSPSDSDADGGAVYLVSVGTIYAFSSMQQFTDFGFNTNNITYLPLSFISSLKYGGGLSYFFSTPTSNAFQVSGGAKRIILDGATYNSLNPSGRSNFFSDGTTNLIPSGMPISNREVLISSTAGSVFLFANNTYYVLPALEIYNCWGFSGPLGTPFYKLANDSYIGAISNPSTLGCKYNTNASSTYILSGSSKILIPSSFGVNDVVPNQDLLNLINKLPDRPSNLNRAVKTSDLATIWYIESGTKRPIPSMADFNLLGLDANKIDTVANNALQSVPGGGMKIGLGQVVKTDTSGAVYVITSDNSRYSVASGEDFTAFGYNWGSIETFPAASLNQYYPAANNSLSSYLYDQATARVYLMGIGGCYYLSSSQLTSFGQTQGSIQSSQTYPSTIFPYISLGNCKSVSLYVKYPSSGTVYWVDSGQKHPFTSWQSLQSHSGTATPYIITLTSTTLNSLTTGSSL
jgi:hypothetical protein